MKDANDTKTAELIDTPKRRGRPASGQAMSAAERKKAQRNRWLDMRMRGDLSDVPVSALLDWITRAVRIGAPELVELYAGELAARARVIDAASNAPD